jgi:hypothetical protein
MKQQLANSSWQLAKENCAWRFLLNSQQSAHETAIGNLAKGLSPAILLTFPASALSPSTAKGANDLSARSDKYC